MLTLLSPAKSLDFESKLRTKKFSQPRLVDESVQVMDALRRLGPGELSKLMSISPALAELNVERNLEWDPEFSPGDARPAILAFAGDVYIGMGLDRFGERDFTEAQKAIRILSGLHGLLRPLDLIHPYRLEMGSRLATPRGSNLYEFWGTRITDQLNTDLAERKSRTVVNLASNEYFKAIRTKSLDARVISPVFLDEKNGEAKIISFFAKRARGAMAAWIVLNRVKSARALSSFDGLGYTYDPIRSTTDSPTFIRAEVPT